MINGGETFLANIWKDLRKITQLFCKHTKYRHTVNVVPAALAVLWQWDFSPWSFHTGRIDEKKGKKTRDINVLWMNEELDMISLARD